MTESTQKGAKMDKVRAKNILIPLFVAVVACFSPLHAFGAKSPISNNNLCHTHAKAQELIGNIPTDLLTTISLAETGRWDPKKREMFAWPWTVTWGGKGRYFPTKQDAISAVTELQYSGVKNIDVGCMQINLMYHPEAFKDLNEAFDPTSNINYARRFLGGLYNSTGSWIQAAANYHSTNPLLNLNYQTKILKIWRKVSGVSLSSLPATPSRNPAYRDPRAHAAQVALLNSRFRARLEAERGLKKPERARSQLEAWRNARTSPNLISRTAALRKAKFRKKQKNKLKKDKKSFAKKRLEELAKWRKDRYFFQR